MKYSIIIAVYNRLEEVKELLETVELLQFPRKEFEILFSDDGSNDGFQEFIEGYKSESELVIRSIYQENQGPGAARNHAMDNAKGDFFIYVDSDCLFPSYWLRKIDEHIALHKPDAFGGPDTCHPKFPSLLKAINYSMTSFIGTGGTRGSKKAVTKFYPRSFNMGISRKVYETVGGMGNLRHGQDMEFSARIYRAGFKVDLIADAFVYHKRRTSLKKFFKQIFNWGVARINLGKMDKQMLKPIHFAPAVVVLWIIASILLYPFGRIFRRLFNLTVLSGIGVAGFAYFESYNKYKSKKVSRLSILTLFIQVFAYGLGLIWGIWKSKDGKVVKGFTKKYYE
jgi:glycosyltransferase involved in cell wall biosynthesis